MVRLPVLCVAMLLCMLVANITDVMSQSGGDGNVGLSFPSLYTFVPTLDYSCHALYVDADQTIYCTVSTVSGQESVEVQYATVVIRFSTTSTGSFTLLQTYNLTLDGYDSVYGGSYLTVDSSANLYTYFNADFRGFYISSQLIKFNEQGQQDSTFNADIEDIVSLSGLATDNQWLYVAVTVDNNYGGEEQFLYKLSLATGSVDAKMLEEISYPRGLAYDSLTSLLYTSDGGEYLESYYTNLSSAFVISGAPIGETVAVGIDSASRLYFNGPLYDLTYQINSTGYVLSSHTINGTDSIAVSGSLFAVDLYANYYISASMNVSSTLFGVAVYSGFALPSAPLVRSSSSSSTGISSSSSSTTSQSLTIGPPTSTAGINATVTASTLLPAPWVGRVGARGIQQSLYSSAYLPALYLIGGDTGVLTDSIWQSLDGGVTWSSLGSNLTLSVIPTLQGSAMSVLANGVLVIYGGVLNNGTVISTVVASSTLFATSPVEYTAPFTPRYNPAYTTLPGTNTTLFCGGLTDPSVTTGTNDCWQATNPELGAATWTQHTSNGPFPSSLSNAALISLYDVNSTLLLCGGAIVSGSTNTAINTCWVSSTLSMSWSAGITAAWGARSGLVATSDLNGWAYVYGGQDSAGAYYYDLWLSTDQASSWTLVIFSGGSTIDIQQGCLALYYTQQFVNGAFVTSLQFAFYSGYQPSTGEDVQGTYLAPEAVTGSHKLLALLYLSFPFLCHWLHPSVSSRSM